MDTADHSISFSDNLDQVLQVVHSFRLLHRLMVLACEDEAKINTISTLSNLIAEMSLRTKCYTAR